MQPNLKKETGDKGSGGFTWGLPRGLLKWVRAGLSPAGAGASWLLCPHGHLSCYPPDRVMRLKDDMETTDTHQVFQLETHSFHLNSGNLESFQGTENGRDSNDARLPAFSPLHPCESFAVPLLEEVNSSPR
jgi:hypothetical protein